MSKRTNIRYTSRLNPQAFDSGAVGGVGRGRIRGQSNSPANLQDAVFWAGVLSAISTPASAGVQETRADISLKQHTPLRQVGTLCTNAETAILTFELNIADTLTHLESMRAKTNETQEKDLINSWVTDIKEATNFLTFTNRNKRDVISWIASIAGLYNQLSINKVKATLKDVKDASRALNDESQQIVHHIQTNDDNLVKLDQILRREEKALWNLESVLRKEKTWRNVERTVSAVRKLIELLPQHRLTPDAVLLFDIEKEWLRLRNKVRAEGKDLAMPSWHFLLHEQISFWTNREKILIATTIPIRDRQTNDYDLYKLIPTPFLINGRFYHALTEQEFIAVHASTQATLALSHEQINTFSTKVLDTRYYHGPIVENHGDQKECIEALWTANHTVIEQWCHLIATQDKEHAQPINNTAVLWITNRLTTITVHCPNHPTRIKTISSTEILNIKPPCKASSKRLTFIPTPSETTFPNVIVKSWTTPTNTSTWNLGSWSLQQPPKISNNYNLVKRLLDSKHNLIPTWIALTLAIIAILALIIFILWLYIKAKQHWLTNSTPIESDDPSDDTN